MFVRQHDATFFLSMSALSALLHHSSGASESTTTAEACRAYATAVSEVAWCLHTGGFPGGWGHPVCAMG